MTKILCSISTRGRYHSTLPITLQAILAQSKLPDKVVIFDDNNDPIDVSQELIYHYFFKILDLKGVSWDWVIAGKKGQHFNHQIANKMSFDWVWRVDDDCIPEPNVLENLAKHIAEDIGAIGGAILTPPYQHNEASGKIENINNEPNIQWAPINTIKDVEHLHCSFLYRAKIHDYNLGLSRIAHREETLFTFGIFQKGYRVLAVPDATSWHLKNPQGGIRSESDNSMMIHDERIFNNFMAIRDHTLVVLDCDVEAHLAFKKIQHQIKNPLIFTRFPQIVPGHPIEDAINHFGDIQPFDIQRKMIELGLENNLEAVFRKLYTIKPI